MSEIISIPILELMEKTEQWLLNQGYKKNTLGVYKATWNKFRAYSSSPFYDRETAEKFLLRYFGVDVNAIDQKLDIRMRHARRHMSALDEFLRTGEICRRKVRGITTLLAQPDPSTRHGLRDLTLLSLLYDSGARVQEITDLKLKDIRLTNPAMVTLTGKGRKARQVPLMKETCKLLDAYIRNFNLNSEPLTSPLFFNQKGQALSRYGITYILKKYVSQAELDSDTRKISPHVLRHTKAMHLLRAGVNMIYIRDFLGHVDISTTEVYARIDAEMKRKVFEEKVPNFTPNTTMPWEEDKDLLQWLTQFGKKSF